ELIKAGSVRIWTFCAPASRWQARAGLPPGCPADLAPVALIHSPIVPDLPWTARAEMEPGPDYLVMASYLPLKSVWATERVFRGVSAVRRQLAAADGLVGYTLRARPLARDYWTLSVWRSEMALREFMRTPPHVSLMKSLRPVMGATKFAQWMIKAEDGRPSW